MVRASCQTYTGHENCYLLLMTKTKNKKNSTQVTVYKCKMKLAVCNYVDTGLKSSDHQHLQSRQAQVLCVTISICIEFVNAVFKHVCIRRHQQGSKLGQ